MTTGKSSPLKTYYLTRNRLLFMRRNMPWRTRLVFTTYFVLLTIPKNTLQYLYRGQLEHLRSFWRGIFSQLNPKLNLN
jgi:hypothetical protein